MNVFERDNAWQRKVRDLVLAPGFYGSYAQEGRYVFVDKGRLSTKLQREYAVDTIVQGKDGAALCIEEKIVRWPAKGEPYTAYTLETDSCTVPGREKDGWMKYAQADFLLYAFQWPDRLVVHLIDFPKLQAWFWPKAESFKATVTEQINHTRCRIVPFAALDSGGVPRWVRDVYPDFSEAETATLFSPKAANSNFARVPVIGEIR
jgi:hypothetical protein